MNSPLLTSPALVNPCLIRSQTRHQVRTLTIRQPLIGWVQMGQKTLFGAQQHQFTTEHLFLIAAGTQWDVLNDPNQHSHYQAAVLQLEPSLINEFAQRYPNLGSALTTSIGLTLDPELQYSFQRVHQPSTSSSALQELRAMELLLLLAERGYRFQPEIELNWADKVRRLVATRPEHQWSIDQLAQTFCTSPSTLSRRIRACEHSLGALVREVRLELGLGLLQTTSLTVGEIANRCGYQAHGRFSAAFRQRFGFCPSELRPEQHPAPFNISG